MPPSVASVTGKLGPNTHVKVPEFLKRHLEVEADSGTFQDQEATTFNQEKLLMARKEALNVTELLKDNI